MSMPPMSGGLEEVDLDMEFGFGPFASDGRKIRVSLDPRLWRLLGLKKDLTSGLLRWFLMMNQFDLEVRDKG